jgi:ATP adenylyltransferase
VNQQRLIQGTLRPLAVAAAARARVEGSLQPIATDLHVVEQEGIPFLVRVLAGRAGRETAQQKLESANIDAPPADVGPSTKAPNTPAFDPFLPYEPQMFVADVSPTHICLLNKFNVIDNHLLVVTRGFEEQESALNAEDFAALWACMAEIDGFAFYNAGKTAGASQRHKHLQITPLPWGPGDRRLPIEEALAVDRLADEVQVRRWPYVHAALRLDRASLEDLESAGEQLLRCYMGLLHSFGLALKNDGMLLPPYNLLATRTWMMLVPRRHEAHEGIAVNALGFGGSLLVRSNAQLAYLKEIGPLAVLRGVGWQDESGSFGSGK